MALLYAGQGTYVGGTIHYAQYQEKSDKLRHGGSAAFVRDSIAGCHREHCQGGHNYDYRSVCYGRRLSVGIFRNRLDV